MLAFFVYSRENIFSSGSGWRQIICRRQHIAFDRNKWVGFNTRKASYPKQKVCLACFCKACAQSVSVSRK